MKQAIFALKLLLIMAVVSWLGVIAYIALAITASAKTDGGAWLKSLLDSQVQARALATEKQKAETARTLASIEQQRAADARRAKIKTTALVTTAETLSASAVAFLPAMAAMGLSAAAVVGLRRLSFARLETPRMTVCAPVRAVYALAQQHIEVDRCEAAGRVAVHSDALVNARLSGVAGILGKMRGMFAGPTTTNQLALPDAMAPQAATLPTVASLLDSGEIIEGRNILIGFDARGNAVYRNIKDIRAMSIAGGQGSGKTLTMTYLTTAFLMLDDNADAYVVDPHSAHDEGLGSYLSPLFQTGRARLVNPMELGETIDMLNARIDARIAGKESSDAPVVLVIDELATMGRTPLFKDKLLPLIERFTEETRKVNFVGVFGSQKWNARHFGGKADIRGTIPSLLVHKIKPSQADLLLEDKAEARLVKGLTKAGQGLLATAHDNDPSVISVPFCTRADVRRVAELLSHNAPQATGREIIATVTDDTDAEPIDAPQSDAEPIDAPQSNVVPFRRRDTETQPTHTETHDDTPTQTGDTDDLQVLTDALATCENSRKVLSDRSGVSVSLIKEIQAGRRRITADTRQKLESVLSVSQTAE